MESYPLRIGAAHIAVPYSSEEGFGDQGIQVLAVSAGGQTTAYVLFDGNNIQDTNNQNYSYFNDPKYNAAMKAAAKLSGEARYKAYGALDVDMFQIGWIADYFDPFDFINILLDGNNIQAANNNNYSYYNSAKYNKAMLAASKLNGQARYKAYGQLDVDIMKNDAPWAPVFNYTSRDFISANTENYINSALYGHPIINAMAIKK